MKVRLFAQLQSLAGCETIDLPTPPALTSDELWHLLDAKIPGIIRHKNSTRLARNFSYAEAGSTFHEGDEIALIPPVSGG